MGAVDDAIPAGPAAFDDLDAPGAVWRLHRIQGGVAAEESKRATATRWPGGLGLSAGRDRSGRALSVAASAGFPDRRVGGNDGAAARATAASGGFELLHTDVVKHDSILTAQGIVPAAASAVMISPPKTFDQSPPQWVGAAVLIGYSVAAIVAASILHRRDVA